MACTASLLIGLSIGIVAGLLIGSIITMFVFVNSRRSELQLNYSSTAESDTEDDISKET